MGEVIGRSVAEEMRVSFANYAMSVITSRALPDVRDGMKPVHRRVLLSLNIEARNGFKKAAAIVGTALGRYHPHGDVSVYEAMIRMGQPWNTRYMPVTGQGNWGSVDGDKQAAMRYVEARLSKLGLEMLDGLEEGTVDLVDNYDGSHQEPTVLPGAFPFLLCNGSEGIAVGLATKIPPHNLKEVVKLLVALLWDPEIPDSEILKYVPGPDFPTGGVLIDGEPDKAYTTGRGRFVVRGEIHEETIGKIQALVISSIPYQINKARLLEEIAEIVKTPDRATKRSPLEDIREIRDESNKEGIRCVLELARDANPEVIKSRLYAMTQLESSFSANLVVLVDGEPKQVSLRTMALCWLQHLERVTVRKYSNLLKVARKRLHIVEGLLTALQFIPKVVKILQAAESEEEAIQKLAASPPNLTSEQSKAVLSMQLRVLTRMSGTKLAEEKETLLSQISLHEEIVSNEIRRRGWMRDRLEKISSDFGDERRTKISYSGANIDPTMLYEDKDYVITLTCGGYLRSAASEDYRQQGRGGQGSRGVGLKEGDAVEHILHVRTFDTLLFFTNQGKVYGLQVLSIPETGKVAMGRHLSQILPLGKEQQVVSVVKTSGFIEGSVLIATARGMVKRTPVGDYGYAMTSRGVQGLSLKYLDDTVIGSTLVNDEQEILLATRRGMVNRFSATQVRDMGRGAAGVAGIQTRGEDRVLGVVVVSNPEEESLLAVTSLGYAKKTEASEYRKTARGNLGLVGVKVSSKTGPVVAFRAVRDTQDVLLLTRGGKSIRVSSSDLQARRRRGMMVRLAQLEDGDEVSAVVIVPEEVEDA